MDIINNFCDQSKHFSLRDLPYRAIIPFYILHDSDLNIQHIRLYGQIEQLESNPNPKASPRFSYAWIAKMLHVNVRNAKKIASTLVEKGYIEHIQLKGNFWTWRTKKAPIVHVDDVGGVSQSDTGGVSHSDTPGVSHSDTLNTHKLISQNKNINIKTRARVKSQKLIKPTGYKETLFDQQENTSGSAKKLSKSEQHQKNITADNPHKIPDAAIDDWLEIRKAKRAPLTPTAWKKLNKEMQKIKEAGLCPLEAFEKMVMQGWQGLNAEWIIHKKQKNSDEIDWNDTSWINL